MTSWLSRVRVFCLSVLFFSDRIREREREEASGVGKGGSGIGMDSSNEKASGEGRPSNTWGGGVKFLLFIMAT